MSVDIVQMLKIKVSYVKTANVPYLFISYFYILFYVHMKLTGRKLTNNIPTDHSNLIKTTAQQHNPFLLLKQLLSMQSDGIYQECLSQKNEATKKGPL